MVDKPRAFGTLFAAVGVIVLIFGAFVFNSESSFLNSSDHAQGTVVDQLWKTVDDEDGVTEVTYPIIEYVNARTGKAIRATGSVGSYPPDFNVGDRVEILYDPRNPGLVTVNTFWDIWMGSIITLILGTAFTIVGVIIWRYGSTRTL